MKSLKLKPFGAGPILFEERSHPRRKTTPVKMVAYSAGKTVPTILWRMQLILPQASQVTKAMNQYLWDVYILRMDFRQMLNIRTRQ